MQDRLYTKICTKEGNPYLYLKSNDTELNGYEIIQADCIYEMIREGLPLAIYNRTNFSTF